MYIDENMQMYQLIDKILRRNWKRKLNKIIEETVSQIYSRVAFFIIDFIEAEKNLRVWLSEGVARTIGKIKVQMGLTLHLATNNFTHLKTNKYWDLWVILPDACLNLSHQSTRRRFEIMLHNQN